MKRRINLSPAYSADFTLTHTLARPSLTSRLIRSQRPFSSPANTVID